MPSPSRRDGRVDALVAAHGGRLPEDAIASACRALLDEAGGGVPVDVKVLASYRRAQVIIADQVQAETVAWNGQRWIIRVRRRDTSGRQRFSCAHAVVHTFFMEAEASAWPSVTGRTLTWSPREEQLCDLGAAELLLPRDRFLSMCGEGGGGLSWDGRGHRRALARRWAAWSLERCGLTIGLESAGTGGWSVAARADSSARRGQEQREVGDPRRRGLK